MFIHITHIIKIHYIVCGKIISVPNLTGGWNWEYKIEKDKLIKTENPDVKSIIPISGDGYIYSYYKEETENGKYKPAFLKYNFNTKKVEKVIYGEEQDY